ncbi:MAG: DUF2207 domain-containing protein [Candidatus Paceibacterota bacterium]
MANIKKISVIGVFLFITFAGTCTYAQTQNLAVEALTSYNSTITVNVDNSVDVSDEITYVTGSQERHGIYKDIYPYSSSGRKMNIENISVTDPNGTTYPYNVTNSGGNVRVRIGDPDTTFQGEKKYFLRYRATGAVAQLEDIDEIYWNATGNEWNIPIYFATARVVLPAGSSVEQTACYYGTRGSTTRCDVKEENGGYVFSVGRALSANEGMTVAIGFPKGVVTPYTVSEEAASFLQKYLAWIIGILLPILTAVFSYIYWSKKGRDPKGTGIIVPEYDVPDMLTPMEVKGIVSENIMGTDISAEIIYLATMGYVKITETESKVLGLFKKKDYELTKLKDFGSIPNEADTLLLGAIFSDGKTTVKLSDLKNSFYTNIPPITKTAAKSLLTKGYYSNLGRMHGGGSLLPLIIALAMFIGLFGSIVSGVLTSGENMLPAVIGAVLSAIIASVFYHLSPAKTEKGVATKEYILGLKDYLRIAEKDRLEFHNAPDKKPEIFEKLLPYAMILGVADIWAKEFEGMYLAPPSWYSGSSNTAFNAVVFSHAMLDFSAFANTNMATAPGGSSGGGSSGGGGGGGGGGGW